MNDAGAGTDSMCSEQSTRRPNGESAGVGCASTCGCVDCDGELVGVACTQCQSLNGECACLATSSIGCLSYQEKKNSTGCCIPCQEKKSSSSVSLNGCGVDVAVSHSVGSCSSCQENKIEVA